MPHVTRCLYPTSWLLPVLLLAGCASWFSRIEPPEVLVTNVVPLEATPFEQRLQVDLRIRNPNNFELRIAGLDFTLKLNGKRLARGLSSQEATVPRLGDITMSVQTSTTTFDLVRQVLHFSQHQELAYDIRGVLHLTDGRLPFDNSGMLLEKGQLSESAPPR